MLCDQLNALFIPFADPSPPMTATLPWPLVVGLVAPLGLAIGSFLNVEIDHQTQVIVDTVRRYMADRS